MTSEALKPLVYRAIALLFKLCDRSSLINHESYDHCKPFQLCSSRRYAQSLVLGAYTHSFDPTNDYILTTAKTGWKVLAEFWDTPSAELYEDWQKIIESYAKSN